MARDASHFGKIPESNELSVISFDHDLGYDQAGRELPTGQHCMRLLLEEAMDRPDTLHRLRLVILHSANPVGRANMRGLLESAQRHGILPAVQIVERPVTSYPLAAWPVE